MFEKPCIFFIASRLKGLRWLCLSTAIYGCVLRPGALSAATADSGGRLAPAWRDDADGFILRSPRNSTVFSHKGNDIVSFTYAPLRWGLIVHQSLFAKPVSLHALIKASLAADRKAFKHIKVLAQKPVIISGHKAMKFIIRFQAISDKHPLKIMRQQVLVEKSPTQVFLLTFFSPGDLRTGARAMFSRVIKSFRLIHTNAIAKMRFAAVARARQWLKTISAGKLLKVIHPGTRLFQIKAYGRPIGYVAVQVYRGRRDGLYGLLCSTNSRVFLRNGVDVFHKVTDFWAFSHQVRENGPPTHVSQWSNSVETMVPFNNPVVAQLHSQRIVVDPRTRRPKLVQLHLPYPNYDCNWTTEIGEATSAFFPVLNARGKPTSAYVYRTRVHVLRTLSHITAGVPDHPIRFQLRSEMPPFMPPILKLLWPRLVPLNSAKPLGMVAFNNMALRPAMRILSVESKATLRINGKIRQAYLVTDLMDPYESKMWVDARGRLLKYIAGDGSIWTPTTAAKMSRRWHKRLEELSAPLVR